MNEIDVGWLIVCWLVVASRTCDKLGGGGGAPLCPSSGGGGGISTNEAVWVG